MGAVALPLVFAGTAGAAPAKPGDPKETRTAAEPGAAAAWVADELRILRADVESLRQRPEASVAADLAALRSEVSRLSAAQADLERRLGVAPAAGAQAVPPAERGGGMGLTGALIFLTLGVGLGWVGSRLTQRWRDRRLRIRV